MERDSTSDDFQFNHHIRSHYESFIANPLFKSKNTKEESESKLKKKFIISLGLNLYISRKGKIFQNSSVDQIF